MSKYYQFNLFNNQWFPISEKHFKNSVNRFIQHFKENDYGKVKIYTMIGDGFPMFKEVRDEE